MGILDQAWNFIKNKIWGTISGAVTNTVNTIVRAIFGGKKDDLDKAQTPFKTKAQGQASFKPDPSKAGKVQWHGGQIGQLFNVNMTTQQKQKLDEADRNLTPVLNSINSTIDGLRWVLNLFRFGTDLFRQFAQSKINSLFSALTGIFSSGGAYIIIHPWNSKTKHIVKIPKLKKAFEATARYAITNTTSLIASSIASNFNLNLSTDGVQYNVSIPLSNKGLVPSKGDKTIKVISQGSVIFESPPISEDPTKYIEDHIKFPALSPRQAFNELFDSFNENTPTTPQWNNATVAGGMGIVFVAPDVDLFIELSKTLSLLSEFFNFKEFRDFSEASFNDINTVASEVTNKDGTISGTWKKFTDTTSEMWNIGTNRFVNTLNYMGVLEGKQLSLKNLKVWKPLIGMSNQYRSWVSLSIKDLPLVEEVSSFLAEKLTNLLANLLKVAQNIIDFLEAIIRKVVVLLEIVKNVLAILRALIKWLSLDVAGAYVFIIPPFNGGKKYIIDTLKKSLDSSPLSGYLDNPFSVLFFAGYGAATVASISQFLNANGDKQNIIKDEDTIFDFAITPDLRTMKVSKGQKIEFSVLSNQVTDTKPKYYDWVLKRGDGNIVSQKKISSTLSSTALQVNKTKSFFTLPDEDNSYTLTVNCYKNNPKPVLISSKDFSFSTPSSGSAPVVNNNNSNINKLYINSIRQENKSGIPTPSDSFDPDSSAISVTPDMFKGITGFDSNIAIPSVFLVNATKSDTTGAGFTVYDWNDSSLLVDNAPLFASDFPVFINFGFEGYMCIGLASQYDENSILPDELDACFALPSMLAFMGGGKFVYYITLPDGTKLGPKYITLTPVSSTQISVCR